MNLSLNQTNTGNTILPENPIPTPDGLDNFNRFFNILLFTSAIIEVIYIISPRAIQSFVERADHNFGKVGVFKLSFSSVISFIFLMLMGLFLLQESSIKTTEFQQKLSEPSYETNFRHRNQWMIESYYYQSQINAIIWLTLNIIIKRNRKYENKNQELVDMFKNSIPIR
eukprot:403335765